jgi:hypothetical protein
MNNRPNRYADALISENQKAPLTNSPGYSPWQKRIAARKTEIAKIGE